MPPQLEFTDQKTLTFYSDHARDIVSIVELANPKDATPILMAAGGAAKDVIYEIANLAPIDEAARAGDIDLYLFDKNKYDDAVKHLNSVFTMTDERALSVNYVHKLIRPGAYDGKTYKIQLVKPLEHDNRLKMYGTMADVCAAFDLTICACAISIAFIVINKQSNEVKRGQLMYFASHRTKEHLKEKVIRFQNCFHPFSQIIRTTKYLGKGYKISPVEFIRILNIWYNMDDSERKMTTDLMEKFGGSASNSKDEYELMMMLLSGPAVAFAKQQGAKDEPTGTDIKEETTPF